MELEGFEIANLTMEFQHINSCIELINTYFAF
jgi:hypothetical protein